MGKNKRILIIDDDLLTLTSIVHYLKKDGYTVEEIENPIKAKTLLSNIQFDCVIVDYSMPEMNGLELVKWIREHENKKIAETPILLLTAWEEMTIVREAYFAGINLFRTKAGLLSNPKDATVSVESAIKLNPVHRLQNKLAVAFKKDTN